MSHFTSTIFILLKPTKSLLVNVKSILTGLSAPCLITILATFKGSVLTKFKDAKPEFKNKRCLKISLNLSA